MFLQGLWLWMMGGSVLYACLTGRAAQVLEAALNGSGQAIDLTLRLGAGYLFFGGLMEIAREAGVTRVMEKWLTPVLKRLMPHMKGASEMVALNLSMNVMGLGNAATPAGLEAMRRLDDERRANPNVRHDMYLFLILNATSLQLLPTTVLTLRAAAGSADANAVLIPTIACTAFSTLVGIACGLIAKRMEEKRHAC